MKLLWAISDIVGVRGRQFIIGLAIHQIHCIPLCNGKGRHIKSILNSYSGAELSTILCDSVHKDIFAGEQEMRLRLHCSASTFVAFVSDTENITVVQVVICV